MVRELEQKIIIMSTNSTNVPPPPGAGGLIPILSYGGVAVTVIIAMTWFAQMQLKSITDLLKVVNKNRK
ncbi:hypothetical protein GS682_04210 [Nostoc sp. B(2019)]|nr:hypothetical protein [Nostoc sp. B(2019)]